MSGSDQVAIIGIAGRFPGASDPQQLWLNLLGGVSSIACPSDAELLAVGVPARMLAHPGYVRAVACAPDVENFDADFFGFTPKDALTCDPQIRMFLESAHAAVENAGYDPYACPGSVGVYGSAGTNRYMDLHLGYGGELSATADFAFSVLNYTDYLASTVSYKLGLRGPAITLATACSSSLVAVHLACQALRSGECDIAVAGGSEMELPLRHGYLWEEGGPLSRDGQVRPFDVAANGTVFGTGVGVVVLKRLADAIADGDTVLAVIRGSAINNDGSDKAGFSAPSVSGQALMLAEAMAMADTSPADISYVECHATATRLGDPIEVAALDRAYRRLRPGNDAVSCAIGSVKGNIGHLGHAAGAVSLIKVILALCNGQIPATVNFTKPNPELRLDRTPFYVASQLRPWPRTAGRPRCAGVSAFGVGGTNAHLIVTDGQEQVPRPPEDRPRIVVWSAKTAQAEQAYRGQLGLCLGSQRDDLFAAAVSTLQDGRRAYPVRRAIVASSAQEAAAALRGGHGIIDGTADGREIVFMFPGQGSQRTAMAAGLYRADPVFRSAADEVFGLFEARGTVLRQDWLNGPDARLADTRLAQPVLFAIEYALAQMLAGWGIRPSALLGHSLGEVTAAAVAGVFALPDAVAFVHARAAAMASAPAGRMLAVALPPEDASSLLPPELSIAVVNSRSQTVVAGPADDIGAFQRMLAGRRIQCTMLRTCGAFHSPLMSVAAAELALATAGLRCGPPEIPLYSAASGRLLAGDQTACPGFWAAQVAEPVRFDLALGALLAGGGLTVLEVGAGTTLTAVSRSHPARGKSLFLPVLPRANGDPDDEFRQALHAAGRVWASGHDLDWHAVRGGEAARRVPLPGYQYQRRRCWAELRTAANTDHGTGPARTRAAPTPPPASQFSTVHWREEPRPALARPPAEADCLLLVPADTCRPVLDALRRARLRPVTVWPGPAYAEAAGGFTARPGSPADIARVLATLAARGVHPAVLVHALTAVPAGPATVASAGARLDQSLHSFLALVAAGTRHTADGQPPAVLVITARSVDVTGAEPVDPATAVLPVAARSVSDARPVTAARPVADDARRPACRVIDIAVADETELAAEAALWRQPGVVAIRGSRRWASYRVPLAVDQVEAATASVIRRSGVYILTGGLDELGMAVARRLAESGGQPRLALLTRENALTGSAADRPARLADQIAELRGAGARVHVIECDLADPRALRQALDAATTVLGRAHGVVQLAGPADDRARLCDAVPRDGTASEHGTGEVMARAQRTLALAEALAGRPPLDFFASFSSQAAIDGLPGDPCRAAAHAMHDACVLQLRRSGLLALTIDWPCADEASGNEPAIEPRAASGLLCILLRSRHLGQVLVTPGHIPAGQDHQDESQGGASIEERMIAIWADVTGDLQIGPDANFLEIGGNSLTAASLASSIGREFGIDVPIAELYSHPTIRGLAEALRARGIE